MKNVYNLSVSVNVQKSRQDLSFLSVFVIKYTYKIKLVNMRGFMVSLCALFLRPVTVSPSS